MGYLLYMKRKAEQKVCVSNFECQVSIETLTSHNVTGQQISHSDICVTCTQHVNRFEDNFHFVLFARKKIENKKGFLCVWI